MGARCFLAVSQSSCCGWLGAAQSTPHIWQSSNFLSCEVSPLWKSIATSHLKKWWWIMMVMMMKPVLLHSCVVQSVTHTYIVPSHLWSSCALIREKHVVAASSSKVSATAWSVHLAHLPPGLGMSVKALVIESSSGASDSLSCRMSSEIL